MDVSSGGHSARDLENVTGLRDQVAVTEFVTSRTVEFTVKRLEENTVLRSHESIRRSRCGTPPEPAAHKVLPHNGRTLEKLNLTERERRRVRPVSRFRRYAEIPASSPGSVRIVVCDIGEVPDGVPDTVLLVVPADTARCGPDLRRPVLHGPGSGRSLGERAPVRVRSLRLRVPLQVRAHTPRDTRERTASERVSH